MSSPLTLGAVHAAHLHGIAGAWTITGTATVWATDDTDTVLLQLSDSPSPHRISHATYCRGRVSRLPDGRREVVDLVVPLPGPTRISLGWHVLHQRALDDLPHHIEQAEKVLESWLPLPPGDGPLGVSALPWLARAVERTAHHPDDDDARDDLVRRLRAGGVPRDLVAATDGRSPQRITQIATGATRATVTA
ncbi:hypothetical protein ACGFZP_05220 [Kitasatospora sp. NPDC048239]|uniref:hypothetical protein n=1 Tax=Kitasatospora sp. NPDC048239 TaxID=3364046 RepID=UPI00371C3651